VRNVIEIWRALCGQCCVYVILRILDIAAHKRNVIIKTRQQEAKEWVINIQPRWAWADCFSLQFTRPQMEYIHICIYRVIYVHMWRAKDLISDHISKLTENGSPYNSCVCGVLLISCLASCSSVCLLYIGSCSWELNNVSQLNIVKCRARNKWIYI